MVPVKRIRKVDPAEEGAYIISMPKGTTQRTQKILQQKGKLNFIYILILLMLIMDKSCVIFSCDVSDCKNHQGIKLHRIS